MRLALGYLVAGFIMGGVILIGKGLTDLAWTRSLLPLHIELVAVGWILQLVIGVSFWILPRFEKPPVRGKETRVWASLICLNGGILLVGLGTLLPAQAGPAIPGGRVLEVIAILLYVRHIWPRVKPFANAL
ncbi:MAG: hypothetical protein D6681_15070 [Calditrichaeota bacterium]|nr:MAG: hypothetical protein D6681_15070 [Calditrichota bacterium]